MRSGRPPPTAGSRPGALRARSPEPDPGRAPGPCADRTPAREGGSVGDAPAELVEQRPGRLDALRPQRPFKVSDERLAELRIGFGAGDESVELPARSGKLLRSPYPGCGGRREHPDQAGKPF